MEIKTFTIEFLKKKAKSKLDEDYALLLLLLQCKLQTEYSNSLRSEEERTKTKLSKIASIQMHGIIMHSKACSYEHGEQNSMSKTTGKNI